MSETPAGWHPDPQVPGQQRYWDGRQWTPQVAPMPPPPPASPPRSTQHRKVWLWVGGAFGALVLIGIIGSLSGGSGSPKAAPTAPSSTAPGNAAVEATPTPTPPATIPRPRDFSIGIRIRKKDCFGSAGCNITYQINPSYNGTDPSALSGSWDITYQVTGGDSGPQVNTMTLVNGTFSFDQEESLSTGANPVLRGSVVRVETGN